MPVVGVASKLRQPGVGSKPVHTALPIPNLGRSAGVGVTQGYAPRAPEVRASESPLLSSSCQLSLKGEYQERRTPPATRSRESEESKISKVSVSGEGKGVRLVWNRFPVRVNKHTCVCVCVCVSSRRDCA